MTCIMCVSQSSVSCRSESRLTVRGQGSLVLSDVTSRDTGVYTCRAVNSDDASDAVAHVRVIGK